MQTLQIPIMKKLLIKVFLTVFIGQVIDTSYGEGKDIVNYWLTFQLSSK